MKHSKKGLIAAVIGIWIAIPGTLIVVIALAMFVPQIGARIFNLIPKRRKTRESLRNAFAARGLNPNWIDAIGYVESRWNPDAVNRTGSDALRGGSYGATQMSWKTLQAIGYGGTVEAFLGNAELQGQWSAIYMERGNPETFADATAWWNAGRKHFSDLPDDHMTRTKYFPKAEKALAYVESNPVELAA